MAKIGPTGDPANAVHQSVVTWQSSFAEVMTSLELEAQIQALQDRVAALEPCKVCLGARNTGGGLRGAWPVCKACGGKRNTTP